MITLAEAQQRIKQAVAEAKQSAVETDEVAAWMFAMATVAQRESGVPANLARQLIMTGYYAYVAGLPIIEEGDTQ